MQPQKCQLLYGNVWINSGFCLQLFSIVRFYFSFWHTSRDVVDCLWFFSVCRTVFLPSCADINCAHLRNNPCFSENMAVCFYFGACCLMNINWRSDISFLLSNITSLRTSKAFFALNKTLHIISYHIISRHCSKFPRAQKRGITKGHYIKKNVVFAASVSVSCLISFSFSHRVCFPRPVSVMPVSMSLATSPKEKVRAFRHLTCIKHDLFEI